MQSGEPDPRIIRTRKLLQSALMALMQEKTFQSISVGDITTRATLNRATFYLHYLDKFDLLSKTARDTFIEVINVKIPTWNGFHMDNIRSLAHATCDYLAGFLKGCAPANKPYEPLIESEILHVLYDYIYCWLDNELKHPQHTLIIETCAMVVSSSVLNMCLKWSRGETAYSRNEVVEQVCTVITQGVSQYFPQSEPV